MVEADADRPAVEDEMVKARNMGRLIVEALRAEGPEELIIEYDGSTLIDGQFDLDAVGLRVLSGLRSL